ncbi:MAG: asparagine synthase (glutamine-hydrolyzing) [Methanobacteriota archaeon]
MCGITGIVLKDRSAAVDVAALDRMTDILAHRGPDGRGTERWGNVAFGHRRLAIIDLDTGDQPMATPDGSLWVTFNGEISNFLELRSELIQDGYRFRTTSDTEVLLHLYHRDGVKMLERLNGMFAFAIYDRANDRLLLARDRFGEKPLYLYEDDGRLLFASEIKGLLAAPGVRAEPDWQGVHEYLTFQFCLGDRTMFRGIRKLRPAHYLVLDGAGRAVESGPYWTLHFEEDHTRNEEYWTNELRFLLEDSVRIRLRSDVPVGAYLSGGIDSSTVATLGSKLLGKGLPSFTGYFAEGEKYNELGFAKMVATANRSPHHVICPTSDDFAHVFRRLIYHMDEPAAGPGSFPQMLVSGLARKHVKVVLGGQGGDEIFAGYARYLAVYLEQSIHGSIFGTQDPAKHIVTMDRVLPNLAMLRDYVPLLREFWAAGLFAPIPERYYRLVNRAHHLDKYLAPRFLATRDEGLLFSAFTEEFDRILREVPSGRSSLINRMTSFDLRTSLASLLQVEDRMSMAVSLESRLPFLDHRIVELAFRMPPELKFKGGRSKAIVLDAAKPFLPKEIVERRDKKGFPVPVVEWLRGPLKAFAESILLGDAARHRGIYDVDGIRNLFAREDLFSRELWGLLCLEVWFQTFIDQPIAVAETAAQAAERQGVPGKA